MPPAALPRSAFQRRRPPKAARPAWKVAEAFCRWLRGLENCACGARNACCSGPLEAAHVDIAGGKGIGTKVADRHSIPLSRGCHAEQHRVGWLTFEKTLPTGSAVALATSYWAAWPGRVAWERENGEGAR